MNARNRQIVEQRAAGRTVQSIALEHGLSPARVCKIVQDHQKDVEVARLQRVIAAMDRELEEAHGETLRLQRLLVRTSQELAAR